MIFTWMTGWRAARSSSCFPEWRACAIEFRYLRQAYQACSASSRAPFEARVTGNGFPDPNKDRLACEELAKLPHLKLGSFSGSIQYDSILFPHRKKDGTSIRLVHDVHVFGRSREAIDWIWRNSEAERWCFEFQLSTRAELGRFQKVADPSTRPPAGCHEFVTPELRQF